MLINAGPTHEPIDPVRFIANHSSGRMGLALAAAAIDCGACVRIVAGPGVAVPPSVEHITTHITTAAEMAEACIGNFSWCEVAILAAAVADYTPVDMPESKMKRGEGEMVLRLKPTTDIAATLGSMKQKGQMTVGFALETDNEMENAAGKLKRKRLDMIVLNSLRDYGAGFGTDTNRVTIIDSYNNIDKFELKPKDEVALDILVKVVALRKKMKL